MSSGHDTSMPTDNLVNEQLIAYHRARAEGGVGLIVLQVAGVHDSARYTSHVLMATDDACIDGYPENRANLPCPRHRGVVPGVPSGAGKIMESSDGLLAVAYSASAVPNEAVPGHAACARSRHDRRDRRRLCRGSPAPASGRIDGVEVVASHGYLPAQFINPRVNRRTDGYNGDLEQRLRFLREVIAADRAPAPTNSSSSACALPPTKRDPEGPDRRRVPAAVQSLQAQLDYVHIVAGTSASLGGAVHIVRRWPSRPPTWPSEAGTFKAGLDIPLFVTGRINQPQEAELIIARGQADVCGMTRAPDLRPGDAEQDRQRPR